MAQKRKPQVDMDQPTTILTQLGPMSALPKLARNETLGYTKRHDKTKQTKVT